MTVGQFLRLPLFVTTGTASMVGIYWGGRSPDIVQISLALVYGFAIHVFGALQNDVADLAVDETNARRSTMPLPDGVIGVSAARALVVIAGLGALAVPGLAGNWTVLLMTIGTLGAFTYYNLAGRAFGHPVVSDALCGAASASPAIAVVSLVGGNLDSRIWLWFASFALLVGLYTGYFGGFRDYENDRHHARRTTAGWLLAYSSTIGGPLLTRAKLVGASGTSVALAGIATTSVLADEHQYHALHLASFVGLASSGAALFFAVFGLYRFRGADAAIPARIVAGMLAASYVGALSPIAVYGGTWVFPTLATTLVAVLALSPAGRGTAEIGYGSVVAGLSKPHVAEAPDICRVR